MKKQTMHRLPLPLSSRFVRVVAALFVSNGLPFRVMCLISSVMLGVMDSLSQVDNTMFVFPGPLVRKQWVANGLAQSGIRLTVTMYVLQHFILLSHSPVWLRFCVVAHPGVPFFQHWRDDPSARVPLDDRMAWILDLPVESSVGEPCVVSLKAWPASEQSKTLRWDLRKIFTAVGYDCNAKHGKLADRLADMRGMVMDAFSVAGIELEEPFFGYSYASEAQRRKRRLPGAEEKLCEQEYWVDSQGALVFFAFLAQYRRGQVVKRMITLLLRQLLLRTCPTSALSLPPVHELPENIAQNCTHFDPVAGVCCHARNAPLHGPRGSELEAGFMANVLIWALGEAPACGFASAILRRLLTTLVAHIEDEPASWGNGDLIRHSSAANMEEGRKRARRFDMHVRQQLMCTERQEGMLVSSTRAWRILHGAEHARDLVYQERVWMDEMCAAWWLLCRPLTTVGACFDETDVGKRPRQSLNISSFFFPDFHKAAVGAPQATP